MVLDVSKSWSFSRVPKRVFGAMAIAPKPSVALMAPTSETSRRPVFGEEAAKEYCEMAMAAKPHVQPAFQRSVHASMRVSSVLR